MTHLCAIGKEVVDAGNIEMMTGLVADEGDVGAHGRVIRIDCGSHVRNEVVASGGARKILGILSARSAPGAKFGLDKVLQARGGSRRGN